jgi:NADH-quinone oxidoreductase subunit L
MLGQSPLTWALIALFGPAAVALLIGVVPPLRRSGRPAAYLSLAAAFLALAASAALVRMQLADPTSLLVHTTRWLPDSGRQMAELGIRIDGISASMLFVVTSVASAVQLFSLGYMASEPPASLGRYYGLHSLFIFAMNLLVLAPNMLQAFAGWELVGLTSYLLIGFWWQKPSAARAAVKAFWITKLADMGLLIGLILLFAWSGGFSWQAELSPERTTIVTLLFFLAVMGKSAQFPLHIWLPDAMEGPTPVSALLHAATMVAAGVYLVVRANPLFASAPLTLELMAWIGAFTAIFAASVAVVQSDIKRVLAYSTCSQLGYMICALGAGSLMGGFFHLTMHAFFKALLFLAAGSVIHAVHSNQLADMGGLARRMKLTTAAFVIGALALAGIPGLAGFFSKDLILEAVAERGLWGPFALLMAAAFLTAFYMGRVLFLAFFGAESKAAARAHEHGPSMGIPLALLSLAAIVAGYFGGGLSRLYGVPYAFHLSAIGMAATGLALAGFVLAWAIHSRRAISARSLAPLAPLGRLARSAAVDRSFEAIYRRIVLVFAHGVGWFDRYVIDGLMNLSAWATITLGERLRRIQTGNAQDYVLAVIAGAIALVVWGMLG